MAISVGEDRNTKLMIRTIGGVVVVIALVIATYILFFTTPPQIEVIAPPEVQTISQISEIDLDPSTVINSPEYKALKEHVPPPVLGEFGRANPFARF